MDNILKTYLDVYKILVVKCQHDPNNPFMNAEGADTGKKTRHDDSD